GHGRAGSATGHRKSTSAIVVGRRELHHEIRGLNHGQKHCQTIEPSLAGGFGGYVANSEDRRAQRSGEASHPDLPRGGRRLDARDVSGLEPLGTRGQFEFHGVALIQALVTAFLDRGKMYKYGLAGRALNETIALGPVE